jgi:hypothetical protein
MNTQWFSHVLGLLEVLRQRDAWEGTDEEIQAAIDAIDELEASMSECGGGGCCRTTSTLLSQMYHRELEKDYDGTPRSVAPLAPLPDFGYNEEDPDPIDVLRRHFALCNAVARYCNSVFTAAVLAMRAAGYVVELAIPAAIALHPIAGVVCTFVGIGIEALIEAFKDLNAIQECICCMYSSLVGAETSYEAFSHSPGACGFSFPENRAQLSGFLGANNSHFLNYALFLRALDEEWSLAQGLEAPVVDCLCPGPCIAEFDFEGYGRQGWSLVPGIPQGHWVDDVGWVSDPNDAGHYLMYVQRFCEPVVQIATVTVDVTATATEGNMIWLAFYNDAGAKVYESAKGSAVGRFNYTFQTNGISCYRMEVSQRVTPTQHHTPITVHRVLNVAF